MAPATTRKRRRRRLSSLTSKDKRTLGLMTGVPSVIHIVFVWIPAICTIILSFTKWDGFANVNKIKFVGFRNYWEILHVFQDTLSAALFNNALLLVFLFVGPTVLGMFLAYLLDKSIRGTAIYQSIFYFPVVLSLAVVGIIWKSVIYSPRQGLLSTLLGKTSPSQQIDWLGNAGKLFTFHLPFVHDALGPSKNFVAVLFAMAWRHTGYIMVLYLSGLKSVDPSLREAAAIDGCNEWQAFKRVILPTMKPINIIIVVITIIESLRTFDIVVALRNPRGMELMATLVTQSILGEGGGQVGRGSAYAVLLFMLCLGFIIWYVRNNFREERA